MMYVYKLSSFTENDKLNFKMMDEKLSKVFEEKLSDRKEYLDMMAQIRGNNDNLYQKMAQAGETRTGALFVDKDNAKAHHQKEQKSPDHHQNNQKEVQTNLKRTKSQKGSRKGKGVNIQNKCDNHVTPEKDSVQQDEEVIALKWAYKTLKEDIKRRKEKHKKTRKIDLKKMQKMQAYLVFKQDLEERSKPLAEEKCWNVTDTAQEKKDSEENSKTTPADKKKHLKNLANANSIVQFMMNSTNAVDNNEDEDEEPILEAPDEKIDEDEPKKEEQKEVQKVIHMNEDQGDDTQKIIDRIMPKNNTKGTKNEKDNTHQESKGKAVNLGTSSGNECI